MAIARFARRPLEQYIRLFSSYGDTVRVPFMPGRSLFILSRPEYAEHVLAAAQDNYVKAFTYRPLRVLIGDGLLTSEGSTWRRHRRIIQPLFSRRHVAGFAPQITDGASRALARWDGMPAGSVVNASAELSALTLDIVGRVLFSSDLRGDVPLLGRALRSGQRAAVVATFTPVPERTARMVSRMLGGPADTVADVVRRLVAARWEQQPPSTGSPAAGTTPEGTPREGTPREGRAREARAREGTACEGTAAAGPAPAGTEIAGITGPAGTAAAGPGPAGTAAAGTAAAGTAAAGTAAANGEEPRDLLGLLMAARDEDGTGLSDEEIQGEVATFLLAGHETTANALGWSLALLSAYPAARELLEEEIDALPGGRPPGAADLDRLPWATAVVNEAMRLYPPAWVIEREAVAGDAVRGVRIPARSTVAVSPYLIHRHPEFWPDPAGFDPRRFLPGADGAPGVPHRYAYIPFGGGRRGCVGAGFAQLESVLVLATLCRQYRLELTEPGLPRPEANVTLRPGRSLPMRLIRR